MCKEYETLEDRIVDLNTCLKEKDTYQMRVKAYAHFHCQQHKIFDRDLDSLGCKFSKVVKDKKEVCKRTEKKYNDCADNFNLLVDTNHKGS